MLSRSAPLAYDDRVPRVSSSRSRPLTLTFLAALAASCGIDQSGLNLNPHLQMDAGDPPAGTGGRGGATVTGLGGMGGGPTGVAGATAGASGGAGALGTAGTPGAAGAAGDAGAPGIAGASGAAGEPGSGGATGVAGAGVAGASGDAGAMGMAGTAGHPDTSGGGGSAGAAMGTAGASGVAGGGVAGATGIAGAAGGIPGTAGSGVAGGPAGAGGAAAGSGGGGGAACTPSNCSDGCCNGATCVRKRTTSLCGASGAACAACGGCQTCDMGQCRVDPMSRWTIVCGGAQAAMTAPNGKTWDPLSGQVGSSAPDLFCQFDHPSQPISALNAGVTSTVVDKFVVNWDAVITPADRTVTAAELMASSPTWRIWVGDEDCSSGPRCGDVGQEVCAYRKPFDEATLKAGTLTLTDIDRCKSLTVKPVCQPDTNGPGI